MDGYYIRIENSTAPEMSIKKDIQEFRENKKLTLKMFYLDVYVTIVYIYTCMSLTVLIKRQLQ